MSKKKLPFYLNPFWWLWILIKATVVSIPLAIWDRFKALIPSYYRRK